MFRTYRLLTGLLLLLLSSILFAAEQPYYQICFEGGGVGTVHYQFLDPPHLKENTEKGELFVKIKVDKSANKNQENGKQKMAALLHSACLGGYDGAVVTLAFPLLERLHDIFRVRFSGNINLAEIIRHLEQMPDVEYAERVPVYKLFYTPNDLHPLQWQLTKVAAEQAWDIVQGSPSITLAIVDDGVLTTHEDLQANIAPNGYDVADDDNNPNPPTGASPGCFSHGTHCAGIASAVADNNTGIASIGMHVRILPVKCKPDSDLDNNCSSLPASIEGIEYAISQSPDVISMSFGGYANSAAMQALFDEAHTMGIVCVAAAGNDNSSEPAFPASYQHVISVGASNENDQKASFSNYGSTIALLAPGTAIYSCVASSNTDYAQQQGTSMACPLVAGVCALMRSYQPNLLPDALEQCLKDNCDDISALNPSFVGQIGAGRLNAVLALQCLDVPPVANFSASPDYKCPGQPISFFDTSIGTNITSWQWAFENGTPASSTLENPTASFSTMGAHNVSLTVTNAFGTATTTKVLNIATPTANIGGSTSIIEGATATLIVTFEGTPPYSFTYSDGTTTSNIDDINEPVYYLNVAPLQNTTYTITAATDAYCSATLTNESANITVFDNNSVQPPPTGAGLPAWAWTSANGSPFAWQWYPFQNNIAIPFASTTPSSMATGYDDCGQPLFYILHDGSDNQNSLYVVRPDGTVLNSALGFDGMKTNTELQLIPVPQTPNEWYVVYSLWTNSVVAGGSAAYTPANIAWARFFYDGTTFTVLAQDNVLTVNGTVYAYTHGKAVAPNAGGNPNELYLYLCRRNLTASLLSIDRFLISQNNILWNANTGDIDVPVWGLTISGSSIEVNQQGTQIAVLTRNQTSNQPDLLLIDANNFNIANTQVVNVGALIVQPDATNVFVPTPLQTVAATAGLGFLTNADQKIHCIEFSPSGQYLYFGGGGFVNGGLSNVTYLGQIDLNTLYPYAMRLQAQVPNALGYNITTGQGCGLGTTCPFFPIAEIETAFDGLIYFHKTNSDTLYILPTPDAPMPQGLVPHWVNFGTATTPNIIMPEPIAILPDGIEGFDYLNPNYRYFDIPVSVLLCNTCAASPANPLSISIQAADGTIIGTYMIEECPQVIEVCLNINENYNLVYDGQTISNAIAQGQLNPIAPFIFQQAPNTIINITPILPLCVSDAPIVLNANPSGGSFSGAGVNENTNIFDPEEAGVGIHTVFYEYIDAMSCPINTEIDIEVRGVQIEAGDNVVICAGEGVTMGATGGTAYQWTPTTGLSDASSATPFATPTTSTHYYVETTDPTGCVARDSVWVFVAPRPYFPDNGLDTVFCQTDTLSQWQLTNVLPIADYTYQWQPSAGLSNAFVPNPSVTITENTIYQLTIRNENGCSITRDYHLKLNQLEAAIEPNDASVCGTDTLAIEALPQGAGYSYQWSLAANDTSRTVWVHPGFYTVTVTNELGCTANTSTEVLVGEIPQPTIGGDLLLDEGESTELAIVPSFEQYLWSTGETTLSIVANDTGVYEVTVTNAEGCTAATLVNVLRLAPYSMAIPNAFSPNNDDVNDVWQIHTLEPAAIMWQVYNRWGQKVADQIQNPSGWNGTFRGNECETGVYVFWVRVVFEDGQERNLKGNLSLIR